jgi:hypothetical protein
VGEGLAQNIANLIKERRKTIHFSIELTIGTTDEHLEIIITRNIRR